MLNIINYPIIDFLTHNTRGHRCLKYPHHNQQNYSVMLAALLLITYTLFRAQEKALNRSILLSNKVELPSKNIDAK